MEPIGELFGFGGGGGGGGGTAAPPPPEAPPPPPSMAKADEAVAAREMEDRAKKRKGRAATMLTGAKGAGSPVGATKTLLGE